MLSTAARPLHIPASPNVVVSSIEEAVGFLRTLSIAGHTEPLIDVMEAAAEPEMERRAWQAFETFACAMRLPVRLGA